jgi:hypothetical protein
MTDLRRAMARGALVTALLVSLLASVTAAQEPPVDREQLARYARAHIALSAARDEFHAKIARVHDDVGLARARQEMDARITEILTENALTSEQYGVLTLLVSENEAVRAVFDEISAALTRG